MILVISAASSCKWLKVALVCGSGKAAVAHRISSASFFDFRLNFSIRVTMREVASLLREILDTTMPAYAHSLRGLSWYFLTRLVLSEHQEFTSGWRRCYDGWTMVEPQKVPLIIIAGKVTV
eukprot:gene3165-biopygen11882